ncbi:hypothetical protein [Intestinirhabdus alba]|uniref:hypothetical protein n=1 Tax=Intestinirhabdus alba TaxID=2899544 RepID=UPI00142EE923|nr:hypothetical protein [Intestinirhabdus alba]
MANLYTIFDRDLQCDVSCFLSNDNGQASDVFVVYCSSRPAGLRHFDLYEVADLQYMDNQYRVFNYEERMYVRSFVEPDKDGHH